MDAAVFPDARNDRFLKVALLLVALALLGNLLLRPTGGAAYGGTLYGYVSGILAAVVLLWLAAYGLRKRWPPAGPAQPLPRWSGQMRHWLSAHVCLGGALPVLAGLHAGFRFSWSLHTFLYVLLLVVTLSGVIGIRAYRHYPRRMTEALGERTPASLAQQLAEIDAALARRLDTVPETLRATIARARREAADLPRLLDRLRGKPCHGPTAEAVNALQAQCLDTAGSAALPSLMGLHELLLQRQHVLATLRAVIHLETRMRFWRCCHGPLSLSLLAALLVHVLTILVYW